MEEIKITKIERYFLSSDEFWVAIYKRHIVTIQFTPYELTPPDSFYVGPRFHDHHIDSGNELNARKCETVFNGPMDAWLKFVFIITFVLDIIPDFFSSFLGFFRLLINETHE